MKIFDTRNKMLEILPKNSVIAELGVFRGDFSEKIIEICEPKEIVLIDIWEGEIFSGDFDGNNRQKIKGSELYSLVTSKFSNNKNVVIHKNFTIDALSKYTDNYFDVIYIDADHTYSGCKSDLEISYKKIKNGGYILGHDYTQNFNKTKYVYNFGVKQAVDNFCIEYNQNIEALGMDGCVSYAIKVKKI